MPYDKFSQLAATAQGGDAEAFGTLYDLTVDDIYKFLSFRMHDPEDAKDLTSQVFLEAWQSLPRFNPEKSFKVWLYSIARYRLIDYYRRYKSKVNIEDVTSLTDKTDLEVSTSNLLQTQEVLRALTQLPEIYQTVIQLKYIQELDYSEIAAITGKPENHLRVLVKRGLDRLKKVLPNE